MHGAGLTITVGVPSTYENIKTSFGVGIIYSPRINLYEKQNLSLSLGIPLSIGFSGGASFNPTSNVSSDENTSFMLNAPLIVNLNLGSGATKDTKKRIGFFIGGGYGFYNASFTSKNSSTALPTGGYVLPSQNQTNNYTIVGPVENIGMRFGVGKQYRNIETKFSLMQGTYDFKSVIYGLATLFNF